VVDLIGTCSEAYSDSLVLSVSLPGLTAAGPGNPVRPVDDYWIARSSQAMTARCSRLKQRSYYPPFPRASSINFNNFGGDIGNDCGRMPMAAPMALAIAAMVGTTGTSPTPRRP
jgi:hypothetical protein